MTPSPVTTAASRKVFAVSTPPRREAGGQALSDNEAKAGVLRPEPGGEPDELEDDEDEDDEDEDDEGDGKPPDDEEDGDDEPADDDDDELDDDERDGWSPAPA
jgi:hypothetical protein